MNNSNAFTIYNASAGSGKTFTLVKQYLLLLFNSKKNDAYRRILAVTFTNKAVAEMKIRIVDALYALSLAKTPSKHESLSNMLVAESGKSSEEIREKAQKVLKNILHDYASFEVSTIDGFTHRVLRTFAKDLHLPLNFEVEMNTTEILQEAVEKMIAKAGKEKQLTRVLVAFALGKADEDKSWDISRDLNAIAKLLVQENNQPFLQLLKGKKLEEFSKLKETLTQEIQKAEDEAVQVANSFFELLQSHYLEETDFSGSYCPKFFKKIKSKDFNVKFDTKWQLEIADRPLYAKKTDRDKQVVLDELQPEIIEKVEHARYLIQSWSFLQAIKKNITPLSLLSAIQDEVEEIKNQRGILLISEFNAIISKSIKNQPAPFIYERLGERYQHYFIDEFQDTSQLQWENLVPLIDHALASAQEAPEYASLTLVGDAKQAIYRWRGGKAEQFMELCHEKNPFQLENKQLMLLPDNYRSAEEIVNFNNQLFSFATDLFVNPEHQKLYNTSAQNPNIKETGYVNISFVEAKSAEEEIKFYPQEILKIIQDLEEQQISKNNICILTRTKKQGISIANFLSENNVPIISFESLLVARSPKVAFLISLLQFSVDGKAKLLKLQILEFIAERLGMEHSYSFISDRLSLENQEFFDSLKAVGIEFELQKVQDQSLYEAVEYAIRSFELAVTSDAYIQFFLDFIYETTQKGSLGILDFLELWETEKDKLSIVAPKTEDAVQIMTIHKAKGLEFPIVIYPFANDKIIDVSRESLWLSLPEKLSPEIPWSYLNVSKKMENWNEEARDKYQEISSFGQLDSLNVLYVALTRASQQLYILSNGGKKREPQTISDLLVSFLDSIGLWNDSNEYQFGDPNSFFQQDEKETKSIQQEAFYSSPTQGTGISMVTRSAALWDSTQEMAIEKGELIHQILSEINRVEDVASVLAHYKEEGFFKQAEEEELKNNIHKVLSHPDLTAFFSGKYETRNECDLISASGAVLRPDRINIMGNQLSIMDYKTGVAKSAHQNQVNSYADVFSEMGYEIDKKMLVYINEEVSVQML